MPRKKAPLILSRPVKAGIRAIKVRLDARTIVTLGDMRMFDFWKQRYPKAQVIE